MIRQVFNYTRASVLPTTPDDKADNWELINDVQPLDLLKFEVFDARFNIMAVDIILHF